VIIGTNGSVINRRTAFARVSLFLEF
jgi:hypothetical protein